MSLVVISFSNDESACGPTLLKTVSTDIFIDKVHKFQNSYFKEHLWKLLLFYKKYIIQEESFKSMLWNMLVIASLKKLFH